MSYWYMIKLFLHFKFNKQVGLSYLYIIGILCSENFTSFNILLGAITDDMPITLCRLALNYNFSTKGSYNFKVDKALYSWGNTLVVTNTNHTICLCRFKVMSNFVKFIGNFLTLLRQSWPLLLGHLTLPSPLNQCCNQTWYAMQFARRVHSNTTLKGGEGMMEIEFLRKKKWIMFKCPNYFCPIL